MDALAALGDKDFERIAVGLKCASTGACSSLVPSSPLQPSPELPPSRGCRSSSKAKDLRSGVTDALVVAADLRLLSAGIASIVTTASAKRAAPFAHKNNKRYCKRFELDEEAKVLALAEAGVQTESPLLLEMQPDTRVDTQPPAVDGERSEREQDLLGQWRILLRAVAAAAPAAKPTAKPARLCGTPGCTLPDFHSGPCSHAAVARRDGDAYALRGCAVHEGTSQSISTFVISMRSRKDRRRAMREQLANAGVDFEFVDAIEGRRLTTSDLRENVAPTALREMQEYASTPTLCLRTGTFWPRLTPGAIGCALSHKQARRSRFKPVLCRPAANACTPLHAHTQHVRRCGSGFRTTLTSETAFW